MSQRTSHRHLYWGATSFLLLAIYLAFFFMCQGTIYPTNIIIGFTSWFVWAAVCVVFRGAFFNRFEFWVHQLVGLDLVFEGFVPIHQGYGFFWCAAGFWTVFLIYHFGWANRRTEVSLAN